MLKCLRKIVWCFQLFMLILYRLSLCLGSTKQQKIKTEFPLFLIFHFFADGFNLERFRVTLREEVRRGIEDAKRQTKK